MVSLRSIFLAAEIGFLYPWIIQQLRRRPFQHDFTGFNHTGVVGYIQGGFSILLDQQYRGSGLIQLFDNGKDFFDGALKDKLYCLFIADSILGPNCRKR